MFKTIDKRLGKEFGLSGEFADVPAFQIINDTNNLLVTFTSRVIGTRYGATGRTLLRDARWPVIYAKKSEFCHRFEAMGEDAVKAAALANDIRVFTVKLARLTSGASA